MAGKPLVGAERALGEGAPSPLLIYDLSLLDERLERFRAVLEGLQGQLLYSIKAQPLKALLERIGPRVDGFSVSSGFEARLALETLTRLQGSTRALHLTSPGLKASDLEGLEPGLTHLSFNSLSQFDRLAAESPRTTRLGLRINPGFSAIDDPRHDPCRHESKLGVPLAALKARLDEDPALFDRLSGLHFHAHFQSAQADALTLMLNRLEHTLGPSLNRLEWINLGGGYALEAAGAVSGFHAALKAFARRFRGTLILEPGQGLIGAAGSLRATVVDVFLREGTRLAVLDTGVHHLPFVFEYQKAPALREAFEEGAYPVLLVGSSCLAGDLFGRYRLGRPLEVGATVHFEGVGAYSLVKASRFNGHDLPAVALRTSGGSLELVKSHGYDEYRRLWS